MMNHLTFKSILLLAVFFICCKADEWDTGLRYPDDPVTGLAPGENPIVRLYCVNEDESLGKLIDSTFYPSICVKTVPGKLAYERTPAFCGERGQVQCKDSGHLYAMFLNMQCLNDNNHPNVVKTKHKCFITQS